MTERLAKSKLADAKRMLADASQARTIEEARRLSWAARIRVHDVLTEWFGYRKPKAERKIRERVEGEARK